LSQQIHHSDFEKSQEFRIMVGFKVITAAAPLAVLAGTAQGLERTY